MTRSLFTLILLLLTVGLCAQQTRSERVVHFEKDRAELTSAARTLLDTWLQECPLDGEYRFKLHGHTDSDGSLSYNQELSAARSRAVQEHLEQQGVPSEAIELSCRGEVDPVRSNADAAGMAMNRRVEVTFERRYFQSMDDLRAALTDGTRQRFTIDPSVENTLVGKAGVRLRLPASAFMDAQGRMVSGPVTVELTEALGHLAMVGHQLATRSGDRILETGGMLKVTAQGADGVDLRLRADRPMEVSVPTDVPMTDMELFLSPNGANWTTTSRPLTVVASWVEPRRPTVAWAGERVPIYTEDQRGKPVKPAPPGRPTPPIAPRRESYPARHTWWSFWKPGRAEAEAEARYGAAMAEHGRRVERYERKLVLFEQEQASYPERSARYEERMQDWDRSKAEELARWRSTVQAPMIERNRQRAGARWTEYEARMEQWTAQRDSSYREYVLRSDSAGTADMGGLRAYLFTTSTLGWINCDRFYDVPEREKHQVVAKGRSPRDTEAYLVFTDIRSLLRMERSVGGSWISPRVPKAQPAMLFAYTVIDGRPHLCLRPVGPDASTQLEFVPSSFAEIGEVLKGFSGSAV